MNFVDLEILLSGGEDHVREFLQELKVASLNEEDVIAGKINIIIVINFYYLFSHNNDKVHKYCRIQKKGTFCNCNYEVLHYLLV